MYVGWGWMGGGFSSALYHGHAVRKEGFEEIPSKHKTLTSDGRFILLVEYPPLNGRHMANDKPNESLRMNAK